MDDELGDGGGLDVRGALACCCAAACLPLVRLQWCRGRVLGP
jgi:hypothetical protein